METPFKYGTLADKYNFVDRVEERRTLKDFLSSGINVMLISPRRWGKSSLVKMAMSELMAERKEIRVCFLDAFSIATEEEFCQTFAREVIKSTSTTLEQCISNATRFLKNISPSITIQSDLSNTMSFDLKIHIEERTIIEVLELPERIAKEKNIHIIVCIDEFQQLASMRNYKALEGKMRSVWQHQHLTSYCFYGSKRHMMVDIFNNSANPFYRFGQILFLQKIQRKDWIPYITEAFKKTEKEISEEQAGRLVDTVKCHSWYVQQLSYFVWSGTQLCVSEELIDQRINMLIDTNMPMFMSDCEHLTSYQIAMLRAIYSGESMLSSSVVVSKYGLGNSQTITRNKRILQEEDFIDKNGDALYFADPVFELWFGRQYM